MNINTSITGTSSSTDRVASGSKSIEPSKVAVSHSTETKTTITNISDLKNAELRGEHYTVSDEQLVKAIDKAIKSMQGKATNLEFTVHDKTKLISVKVLDSDSGEVIREIPPEKTLDFVAKLWEMAGILIDEKR
ncbi:flagellar protein FlaG [Paenibacillus castaneae]|uniref:flagellar protein FlaG n=1 Tax=Paenibacillus castaneae TaxID=474957 RepID=UPI000C9CE515|nr:flagellar protein FlaG [Paenibacillus castaneae]NIK79338.1 flagellar protein FlaG [Paenibacillus castaneae]